MKKYLLLFTVALMLFACKKGATTKEVFVKDNQELKLAIKEATAGTEIVLANGIWQDVQIKFYGTGTEEQPISLRAETPGEVFLEGQSSVHLGGTFLVVDGLFFRNGFSPANGIIRFKINEDSIATNSRVTNCVIQDFNRPNRWENDRWVEFFGRNNQLDHCYISGKANDGETIRVFATGNRHTNNHHQIIHNYFGPRPRKGGPRAETIRVGDSKTRLTPGHVNVSYNFFDACNGEVEIISDKTNYNTYTNNIFYKSEGSLVLRHGNYATVDRNIFIGGDESNFYGGLRVVNHGHLITNNYFYKIKGEEFRSPLAIMNGIPMTPINRYKQVSDVVIAYNSWIDCASPFQIGVGQNLASADVLPKTEIRSAAPIRSIMANNVIYNTEADENPVINHDDMDGILFKNNVLDNHGSAFTKYGVLQNEAIQMTRIKDWLVVPTDGQNESLNEVYQGFEFEKIDKDLFGAERKEHNKVGAITSTSAARNFKIDKSIYGPSWFSTEKVVREPNIISVSAADGELAKAITDATAGDIIELTDEMYTLSASLKIDKEITIRPKGEKQVQLAFNVGENNPAFEMNPKGNIHLNNLKVTGTKGALAFAPLAENMSSAYFMTVENCVIEDFEFVLKATKGSFADAITFNGTTIQNCENGFVLAADEKGDYNAEMVTFKNCEFNNVQQNVIDFYRGGYDESTIGGFLTLEKNTFTACGKAEKSGQLIKTHGIINVLIYENTFQNNPVTRVAVLWGAKNNHHSNNTITASGEIEVQEQQKLKILY